MDIDKKLDAITTGIEKFITAQGEVQATVEKQAETITALGGKFTELEKWLRDVEGKVAARAEQSYDGSSSPLLQAIPERDRKQVAIAELMGKKDPVGHAAACLYVQKGIKLEGATSRPDVMTQLLTERENIVKAFGPKLVIQAMLGETTTNTGVELILTPVEAMLLRQIRDYSAIRQLPVRIIPMTSKTHQLPSLDTDVTAYITAAGAAGTDAFAATSFSQKALTAKKYMALASAEAELVQDSAVALVEMVFTLCSEAIGRLESTEAFEGDGTNNTGVANATGVLTVRTSAAGSAITFPDTIDAIFKGAAADSRANGAFVMHPILAGKVFKLTDTANMPVFQMGIVGAESGMPTAAIGRLNGFPLHIFDGIKTDRTISVGTNLTNLYFGNWSKFIVGDLLGLEFATDPYSLFTSDAVRIRVKKRTGLTVGVPKSFTIIPNLYTT